MMLKVGEGRMSPVQGYAPTADTTPSWLVGSGLGFNDGGERLLHQPEPLSSVLVRLPKTHTNTVALASLCAPIVVYKRSPVAQPSPSDLSRHVCDSIFLPPTSFDLVNISLISHQMLLLMGKDVTPIEFTLIVNFNRVITSRWKVVGGIW